MEREMKVDVTIFMTLGENETEEQAKERFYNQLWSGICTPEDFHMEFAYISDKEIKEV